MTTNNQAVDIVVAAIIELLLEYDHATPARKAAISRTLTPLYAEHRRLTGLPSGANYDATALSAAARGLRALADQTTAITTGLTTATKVVGALEAVLGLL